MAAKKKELEELTQEELITLVKSLQKKIENQKTYAKSLQTKLEKPGNTSGKSFRHEM